MAEIYFDKTIEVLSIEDKQNKRVYRIVAKSENGEFYLELDVHTSLYSMLPGENYRMVISNSLHLDGSDVSGYSPQGKQGSLADEFEFVMHGLLYRISETKGSNTEVMVYISFGGLQLMLRGDMLKMHQFSNRKLFLLLRKM